MSDDRRLIEDYLPIRAVNAEASREKSVCKSHISTLHLLWARRHLVACRAAVYGALVTARMSNPEPTPDRLPKKGTGSPWGPVYGELLTFDLPAPMLQKADDPVI
jgi:adenine-specific DNA methylase